jgi:cyanophycinase
MRVKKEGRGYLVAGGGGESSDITEDTIKIFEKFIAFAGGAEKARVVLMTVATDEPQDAEARYKKVFERLKFKNFETLDINNRSQSYEEAVLKKVEKATGLYFTGGDQLHVTSLIGGTPLSDLILKKFEKGLTVGGTSAGAMMISSAMIVSGQSDCTPRLGSIEIMPGMNLLNDAVIDTHFSQRGRHGRLLSAVAHNPQMVGFGIDERTAMIIDGGDEFEVVGEGAVTVVCAKDSAHTNLPYIRKDETMGIFNVAFHVLPEGYKYDLKKREPIDKTFKEMTAAPANEE